jgi:hypothetical protein
MARKKKEEPPPPSDEAAKKKFERDLLIRGEAAPVDEEGKLPLDATHEVVETKEGEQKIVRRRFKIF